VGFESRQQVSGKSTADVCIHEIVFDRTQPRGGLVVDHRDLVEAFGLRLGQEMKQVAYELLVFRIRFVSQ